MGKYSCLSNLPNHFMSIVLFIVIFGLLPIIIIIWIPVLIYRKAASIVAPNLYPGVTKILTHRSTNLSVDDFHNHEESLTISPAVFEGNIPIESLQRILLERVLQMKLPNGAMRYPELKQHYFHCLGFRFWKNCENFDINDHVKLYNEKEGQVVSEKEMNTLKHKLLNIPFKENVSPWMFLLVQNYIPDDPNLKARTNQPMSVILLKMHHGLADGFSMQKIIMEGIVDSILNDETQQTSKNARKSIRKVPQKRNLLGALGKTVTFPLSCIYEFAQMVIATGRKGPLHVPPDSQAPSVYAESSLIHIQRIKRIKNELDAAFTSVLFCICAGAISKLMIKKQMKLPETLPVIIPIPLPSHPDKLRNHMTNGVVYLPLSQEISLRERLNDVNESYKSLKRSTLSWTVSVLSLLIGGMFPRLAGPLLKGSMPPVVISSFPGADSTELFVKGHRMLQLSVYCGLLNFYGMGIYIITKGEDLKIAAVGNTTLMTSNDVKSFMEFIEQEIELLEHEITPNSVKVHLSA